MPVRLILGTLFVGLVVIRGDLSLSGRSSQSTPSTRQISTRTQSTDVRFPLWREAATNSRTTAAERP